MSLASALNRVDYTGDGSTTSFTFPFMVYNQSDLQVFRTVAGGTPFQQTLNGSSTYDYTQTNVNTPGSAVGGTVTFNNPPLNTDVITLLRTLPTTQPASFSNYDKTDAKSAIELSYDRLCMMVQQIAEIVSRTPSFPIAPVVANVPFPHPSSGPAYLRWNATSTLLEAVDANGVILPPQTAITQIFNYIGVGVPQIKIQGSFGGRYALIRCTGDGSDNGDLFLSQTGSTIWHQTLTTNQRLTLDLVPNGTVADTPSTIEVYGTDFSADGTNWERICIRSRGSSNVSHEIRSEKGGTGTVRDIHLYTVGTNGLYMQVAGTNGIGTTTPRRKFDILDASGNQLRLTQADNSKYTDFSVDSSGNLDIKPVGVLKYNGTPLTTITQKAGSGSGDYTTTGASYADVDNTNLAYTVTIPTGFKLWVNVNATVKHSTLAATISLGILDSSIVAEQTIEAAVAGDREQMVLNHVITGDGNSHTIKLQWKTSASTATMNNSSSTLNPRMVFYMAPSA